MIQPDIYDLLAEDEPRPDAICPRCDRRHSISDTTVSGSRWATGPTAYRATYDGAPSRGTREQAIQDMCDHRQHARTTTTEETR